MPAVKANVSRCQGFANCVLAAPDVFDVNDDDLVVLLTETIPERDRARVESAVRGCPVAALTIED